MMIVVVYNNILVYKLFQFNDHAVKHFYCSKCWYVFKKGDVGTHCPQPHCGAEHPTRATLQTYFLQVNIIKETESKILSIFFLLIESLCLEITNSSAAGHTERLKYIHEIRKNGVLADIDGKQFQSLKEKGWFLEGSSDLGLIIALDRACLFKHNGVQAWPVWGIIANLEPKERLMGILINNNKLTYINQVQGT